MSASELYRSDDGRITVDEDGGVVSLRFNGRLQSSITGEEGLDTRQPYLDFLHAPLAILPTAGRVLVIGLGGGVLPKRMIHDYPEMRVDVVELDQTVVDIAHDYFGLPHDERLRVIVGDGREYLETTDGRYDVIVVDAYHETHMPFALSTLEFVRLARSRLTPGGVLAFNVVGVLEGEESGPFVRFLTGVSAVFGATYVFPVGVDCGGRRQNIVVMGSETAVASEELRDRIRTRVGGRVRVPRFETLGEHLVEDLSLGDARPLTDAETPEDGMLHA